MTTDTNVNVLSAKLRKRVLLICFALSFCCTLLFSAQPLGADSRAGAGSTVPGRTSEPASAQEEPADKGTIGSTSDAAESVRAAASAEGTDSREHSEAADPGQTIKEDGSAGRTGTAERAQPAKAGDSLEEAGSAGRTGTAERAQPAKAGDSAEEDGSAGRTGTAERAQPVKTGDSAEEARTAEKPLSPHQPETAAGNGTAAESQILNKVEDRAEADKAGMAGTATDPQYAEKTGPVKKTPASRVNEETDPGLPVEAGEGKDEEPFELPAEKDPPLLTVSIDGGAPVRPGEGVPAAVPLQKHSFIWSADDTKGEDGTGHDSFSGIRSLSWKLEKRTPEGGLEDVSDYSGKPLFTAPGPPSSPEEMEQYGIIRAETTVEIDGVKEGLYGLYRLTVEAEDFCGNRSEISADLCFDGKGPEAVISAEGAERIETGSGTLYCCKSEAWKNERITVTDEYGLQSVLVEAENETAGKKKTWTYQGGGEAEAGITPDTEGKTVSISVDDIRSLGEGKITFRVHAADRAGNVSDGLDRDGERNAVGLETGSGEGDTAWFLCDNTPPSAQVEMKGGQFYEGDWYYREENCRIGVTLEDEISPIKKIRIELRNEKEGTVLTRKTVSSPGGAIGSVVTTIPGRDDRTEPFTCSGRALIAVLPDELTALKDGKISFTMSAEDAAGNRTDLFSGEDSKRDLVLLREGETVAGPRNPGDRAEFMLDTKAPYAEAAMLKEGRKYSGNGIQYYYRSDNCGLKVTVRDEEKRGGICACRITVRNEATGKELRHMISRTEDLLNEKQTRLVPGEPEQTDPYRIADTITAEFTQKEVGRLGDGPVCVTVLSEDPAGNIGRNLLQCTGMTLKNEDSSGAKGYFVLDMTEPVVSQIRTGGRARGSRIGNQMDAAPYEDGGEGAFYYYNDEVIQTAFTIEEVNPAQMQVSFLNDGTRVVEKVFPEETPDSGEADGKSMRVVCSYGRKNSGKTPEGRYSGICLSGTDRAGNPVRLKKDDSGRALYQYTGQGKNEVDSAGEGTDGENGTVTLKYGKVIDRTAPVAYLTYSTGVPVWLYHGVNQTDGTPETNAENYSIATAYIKDGFTASVAITDSYEGTAGKGCPAVLDSDRLTVEQFGQEHRKADPGKGIRKDGSFSWTFETARSADHSSDGAYYYKVLGTDRAGNGVTVREGFRQDVQKKLMAVKDMYETKDCAGSYRAKFRLILDTESPRFTFCLADPQTGETTDGTTVYYGSRTKTLEGTFVAEDLHLDPGRVKTGFAFREEKEISRYDRTGLQWKETVLSEAVLQKSGRTFSAKIKSAREGIYRFAICGTDKAGNPLIQSAEERKKTGARATVRVKTGEGNHPAADGTGSGSYWTWHKVLDRTAPTGVLEIGNGKTCYYHVSLGKDGLNTLAEGGNRYAPYRSERKAVVSVSSTDLSPVSLNWKIVSSVNGKNREFNDGRYLDDHQQKETVEGEQIFHVSGLTLTDRAGNRSGFIKTGHTDANKIYLDVQPPVGEDVNRPVAAVAASGSITKSSADGRDLFAGGINLKVRVIDPNENVRSAGLEHVTITVRADGNRVLRQTISGSQSIDGRKFRTGRAPLYGVQTLDHSFEKTLRLAAGGIYETNDIEVEVTAADNAGNSAEPVRYRCGIDTTGPVITVRYDNNSAQNEIYFKEVRHATIEVKDRNVDGDKIQISTQVKNRGGFQNVRHAGNGGDDLWQRQISYTEDGDYTLEVSGTDALGNRAEVHYEGTAPRKFTIDRTPPRAAILFDVKEGYRRSRYFPCARTGTVVITDRNFRSRDAEIHVEGNISTPGGTAGVSPETGEWTYSGDRSERDYRFVKDGDYSLSVECTDLAGNKSVRCEAAPFTVDTTKPEIEIEDGSVCQGGIYTGAIEPRIRFSDNNYDPENVFFNLRGVKNKSTDALSRQEVLEDGTGFGGWIHYSDIPARRSLDDLYTASGKITDRAGNTAGLTFSFSVNRFGSTYDYNHDPVTESYVHAYKQEEMDLYLREINVSELVSHDVYVSWNTEFFRLTEGQDYEVTEIRDLDSFAGNVYLYRIFARNFRREGSYDITIQSVDRAGNRNSNSGVRTEQNTENAVPLSFIIDRSDPTVSLRGVDLRKIYWKQESLNVEILPEDNVRLARVNVFLDGRLVGTWINPGKDYKLREGEYPLPAVLEENDGSIPFLFHQGIHPQHLYVEAVDAAGNRSVRKEDVIDWSPVVHASAFVQYYNRKPVFYGSLVLIGLALTAVLYRRKLLVLLWRKKEKQDSQE